MGPRTERRKRGKWEQYNADFNSDETSQSWSNSNDKQNSSNDKDAAGFFSLLKCNNAVLLK